MDVNSLGNANFSNRQNNDIASNHADDTEGTSGSGTPLQNVADGSTSTQVTPPSPTEEALQENNTVQTNEQETGSQVDLTI